MNWRTILKRQLDRVLIRLTGFKIDRWRQWREVLLIERKRASLAFLAISILRGYVGMGGVNKTLWRQRNRACARCPVYDSRLKACRDTEGRGLGCGCFMPLKALVRENACWLRQVDPESRFGFE